MSILSESNYSVVANISGGMGPYDMAYDSNRGFVFVINAASNDIYVISDTTHNISSTITVAQGYSTGSYPRSIACANNGEIFATNSSSVLVITEASSNTTPVFSLVLLLPLTIIPVVAVLFLKGKIHLKNN